MKNTPLFATVILLCILGGIETDLFVPSFPELRRVFDLTPFMVQLTLSLNLVTYCICGLFAGTLGDKYDRKHVIIISLFIFIAGSILTVIAVNFPMLLAGRLLQGIGIAAPTILSYVVISDNYPPERQAVLLGAINGITTISMAFAPTLGSYINLFFHWRANFVALLLLGVMSLVMSWRYFPNKKGNPEISLSPRMYAPLFRSKILMTYSAAIIALVVPYWLFTGISPLLYMEALGVPLSHFGYYQGVIAGVFATACFCSPKIFAIFGQKRCLQWGIVMTFIAGALVFILAISGERNPLIITFAMSLMAVGGIFPINILYPYALEVIEGAKSRIAALLMAFRLSLTSVALGVVSTFYDQTFLPLGLGIAFFLMLASGCLYVLLARKWIFDDN